MTFRFYVYYCAVGGGWLAVLAWLLARILGNDSAVRGMCFGLCLAGGLRLIEAVWNQGLRFSISILIRVAAAGGIGAFGGLVCTWLGEVCTKQFQDTTFLTLGWGFTGAFIGFAVTTLDLVRNWHVPEEAPLAKRRTLRCALGGLLAGLLGGFVSDFLQDAWLGMFSNRPPAQLWSPSGIAFITLGMSIGFLVSAAQLFRKEAWLKVESGSGAGRELLLFRQAMTIGAGNGSDIALLGDAGVEGTHAWIQLYPDGYSLADAGTSGGTWLNGQRVGESAWLNSGDLIQVGQSTLRFFERQKREG
jgi:hypothetical protein